MTYKRLSEQVAALEAECAKWQERALKAERQIPALIDGVVASEAKAATARVEGARSALTRFAGVLRQWYLPATAKDLEAWRDREYPAPSAHAGEARAWFCDSCKRGGTGAVLCGEQECSATRNAFSDCRPAPTPEPEPLPIRVKVTEWSEGDEDGPFTGVRTYRAVDLTPEDCRRIVALGSRPTQTAEG